MFRAASLVAVLTSLVSVAAPVPKSLRPRVPILDGTWEVVEQYSSGRRVNSSTKTTWVIDGESLQIVRNGKPVVTTTKYYLVKPDEDGPNALDYQYVYSNGTRTRTYPGVVAVEGDTLKFGYSTRGTRPDECVPEQATTMYVFKRVDGSK